MDGAISLTWKRRAYWAEPVTCPITGGPAFRIYDSRGRYIFTEYPAWVTAHRTDGGQ